MRLVEFVSFSALCLRIMCDYIHMYELDTPPKILPLRKNLKSRAVVEVKETS